MELNYLFVLLVQPWFIAAYCLGIVLFALLSLERFRSQIAPINQHLRGILSMTEPLSTHADFEQSVQTLDKEMSKEATLNHAWQEFRDTLIFPSVQSAGEVIAVKQTADPSQFFNEANLLSRNLNMRLHNSMPNILTGIGILGTFLGLVAGISLATDGLIGDGSKTLNEGLRGLLDGASLAFATSVVGLFCSLLFSFVEKKGLHTFHKNLKRWNRRLERWTKRVSLEDIAGSQLDQMLKQTKFQEQFVTTVAVEIAGAMDQKLNATLVPALEKMAQVITEQNIQSTTEMADMFRELAGEVRSAAEQQNQTSEKIVQILNSISNETRLGNTAMSDNLQIGVEKVFKQFQETIASHTGKEMQTLAKTLDNLNASLDKMVSEMNESSGNMRDAAVLMAQTIKESAGEGVLGIGRAALEAGEHIRDSLDESMTDFSRRMVQVGEELEKLLSQGFEKSISNLTGATDSLETCIGSMRETVTTNQGMLTELRATMDRFKDISTSMELIQQGSTENLKAMQQASNQFQQAARGVETTMNSLAGVSSDIRSVGDALRTAQNALVTQWQEYGSRFENVDESLKGVFEQLSSGLERYAEMTRDYTVNLDRQMAEITGKLGTIVADLSESVEALGETLNR